MHSAAGDHGGIVGGLMSAPADQVGAIRRPSCASSTAASRQENDKNAPSDYGYLLAFILCGLLRGSAGPFQLMRTANPGLLLIINSM